MCIGCLLIVQERRREADFLSYFFRMHQGLKEIQPKLPLIALPDLQEGIIGPSKEKLLKNGKP